ncbi:hypothetical protein EXIGLDRAFT_781176 [Exidia glandulosa HHB12029]|uniref:Uncharacterized protein n=1 Tax=Exidia glandulosa HHB12029 TaxID=1314781 RepID=A0A165BBW6_EXIGL|nr:hypothetical protein EXIGLDRAFT_781176 [Exidia glandulosa HHB12029]
MPSSKAPSVPNSPVASTYGGATTVAGPSAELQAVNELLSNMKNALGSLGMTFDTLGERTSHVAALAPQLEAQEQIQSLRLHIEAQDERYDDALDEVKMLLKEVMQEQLMDFMRQRVEDMIDEVFAEEVEKQVTAELETHLPQALQDQLQEHRAQLEEVQRSLRNSEARRANAILRYSNMYEPLHQLVTSAGIVSAQFPRDLAELFALDAAKAKALVTEYQLEASESREKNLNKFMQFCGVMYQMVPTLSPPP